MDISKIDLNAPAFGPNSQKLSDISDETTKVEVEPEKVEVEKEEEKAEPSGEDKRVPYSRFKNVWSRAEAAEKAAEEARREADEWRTKAEERRGQSPEPRQADLPNWWIKLYGDSEQSQEAWKIQESANQQLREEITKDARERALEAIKAERTEELNRTNENIARIDSNLEQLETYVGRDLTEKEQSSVLDIVDEFTPKDENGNYLGAPLPFEKAWEIHELKNTALKAPKTKARDAVAALNGSQNQGDSSAELEKDKAFNPSWSALNEAIRKRLG